MNAFTVVAPSHQAEVARLLDAAADPVRLNIVFLLAREKRLNVGDIAARFPKISRPAVSHHLKVLKDAGAVAADKVGQEVYYSLDRERVVDALRRLASEIEACCPSP
jgi:ArsR family transcriptional regulator, arsenate/arsenite/antimonite-responsive transcriptional repressor